MAYLTTIYCTECGDTKYESIPVNGTRDICASCRADKAAKEKQMFLKGLEALTLEERVKRIEAWMYEHNHGPCMCNVQF